jgi:hypothetical protein
MTKKPPTAKQRANWARFARMARARARGAKKNLKRASTTKAPKQAKKKRKTTSRSRKPERKNSMTKKTRIPVTLLVPAALVAGTTLFGRGTTQGALATGKSSGAAKGFARAINLTCDSLTGYWPGLNDGGSTMPGFRAAGPLMTYGSMAIAYGGHRFAEKSGTNRGLRAMGSAVVI